jgi:hypothetical protein
MIVTNKILLSIIIFPLGLIIIGLIGSLTDKPSLDYLVNIGATVFFFSGIYLLAKNGTFIHSTEFRISRLAISIL